MKRLSLFLIIVLALFAVEQTAAQSIALESYAEKLARPTTLGASVRVKMDQACSRALSSLRAPSQKVQGMRVCVYFDNSQNARQGAGAALGRLNSIYPNLGGRVVYQNPFFKVMVGDCIDRIEATRLLGVLKSTFPEAIIVNDGVSISTVIVEDQWLDKDPLQPADPEDANGEIKIDNAEADSLTEI